MRKRRISAKTYEKVFNKLSRKVFHTIDGEAYIKFTTHDLRKIFISMKGYYTPDEFNAFKVGFIKYLKNMKGYRVISSHHPFGTTYRVIIRSNENNER